MGKPQLTAFTVPGKSCSLGKYHVPVLLCLVQLFLLAVHTLTNKQIGFLSYEQVNFSNVEKACVKRFELLNKVDYETFCNTPFEVIYD